MECDKKMWTPRTAFISIVGKPNVGKSSLLNALVGKKVAIVTPKAQTTRTRTTGVTTRGAAQFVFMDTPGLHRSKTALDSYMTTQIYRSILDVDLIALVATATGNEIAAAELDLIDHIKKTKGKSVLILSKIDLLKNKSSLLQRMELFSERHEFEAIVPVSVVTGDGVLDLFDVFEKHAREGPHLFPEGMATNQPDRFIVAEIVREKILFNLSEEIPHTIAVTTEKMTQRERSPLVDIEVSILCEKQSHKGITIGKKGEMLKKIATQSRVEIEAFLGLKVNLKCWVKVKENWRNKEQLFESIGLI
ncbi:MAG: GTPase Era [Oscillospiraceae bacterium]|nr:GTPase Era [Oscillospiraceae bacterium]